MANERCKSWADANFFWPTGMSASLTAFTPDLVLDEQALIIDGVATITGSFEVA